MTTSQSQTHLPDLNNLIEVTKAYVHACLDSINHTESIAEGLVETRMHHLKFDGNGQPMVAALAEYMYRHIIDYCISARNKSTPMTAQEATKLTKEARKLFVHPPATEDDPDQTGEAGELLLYLIIETVLGAPQVVAKMELKTNTNLEVNGSDGIHMAWSEKDNLVDIFFGEAKIYKDVGAAMTAALSSIDSFHENSMCQHEFLMVTKQFKHADDNIRKAVSDLLVDGVPKSNVRINHVCLIGYNWNDYVEIFKAPVATRLSELRSKYLADAGRLHNLWQKRMPSFKNKHLNLIVFFLPFSNIQEFRDAFNKALD